MIEPHELRIGNLVEWHTGSIETINARMILSISEISPGHLTPKGIPITEEWLLKFGFILDLDYKESYDIYAFGLNIAYYPKTNEILLNQEDIPNSNEWITLRKKIKYVHQLQNLFFELTGEELTIKE